MLQVVAEHVNRILQEINTIGASYREQAMYICDVSSAVVSYWQQPFGPPTYPQKLIQVYDPKETIDGR
uniref:Uncharacterized protein n=1 Tax=Megaselia scalaris TaxID=36166 RepID=T1GNV9_MEGSC